MSIDKRDIFLEFDYTVLDVSRALQHRREFEYLAGDLKFKKKKKSRGEISYLKIIFIRDNF